MVKELIEQIKLMKKDREEIISAIGVTSFTYAKELLFNIDQYYYQNLKNIIKKGWLMPAFKNQYFKILFCFTCYLLMLCFQN